MCVCARGHLVGRVLFLEHVLVPRLPPGHAARSRGAVTRRVTWAGHAAQSRGAVTRCGQAAQDRGAITGRSHAAGSRGRVPVPTCSAEGSRAPKPAVSDDETSRFARRDDKEQIVAKSERIDERSQNCRPEPKPSVSDTTPDAKAPRFAHRSRHRQTPPRTQNSTPSRSAPLRPAPLRSAPLGPPLRGRRRRTPKRYSCSSPKGNRRADKVADKAGRRTERRIKPEGGHGAPPA